MKLATSQLTDDIKVSAMGADAVTHRRIAPGDQVDLDEVLDDGRTLARHLGALVDSFALVSQKKAAPKSGPVKPEPKNAPASVPAAKE